MLTTAQQNGPDTDTFSDTFSPVQVINPDGPAPVLFVCEHGSHFVPPRYGSLGLSETDLLSHAAWDPGALDLARHMSTAFDAPLVAGTVSRLVYDCNRPPDSPSAITPKSELLVIPGNHDLSAADRQERVAQVYRPFQQCLADQIDAAPALPALVTLHSFTPVYFGQPRAVEIGILTDSDTRLADQMLRLAPAHTDFRVERNEPYGPEDGVTHTLCEHALPRGALNVMLEIRNDLLRTPKERADIANMLSRLLRDALSHLDVTLTMEPGA